MKPLFALLVAVISVAANPSAAEVIHVDVTNMVFSPAEITAHVGDTIEWNNKDFVVHSATADNKEWDVELPAHGTGTLTLKKAGTFGYFCKYHPNMKAQIEVKS